MGKGDSANVGFEYGGRYQAMRAAEAQVPDLTRALRQCADLMRAELAPGAANEDRGQARHERQRLANLLLVAYGPSAGGVS